MRELFKPSAYNFFIPDGESDDVLLFNGLRSSLIRLPQQITLVVRDILSQEQVDPTIHPGILPLVNMLTEGGFMVESALDEVEVIRERFLRAREDKMLHLVIAPTLDCNLECVYCYQSHSPGNMTIDICDRIIEFAQQKLKEAEVSGINVDWYGGEPLLSPNVISYLSEHFLRLCMDFGCEYEASIATNGTLLDHSVVDMLVSNNVKSCQVTVDGPKEIHDRRRGYRQSSRSSFDQIIKNAKLVIGRMELSVRINVDTDNLLHAYSLLDIFKEEGFFRDNDSGFFPYVAMAGPINPCVPFSGKPISVSRFYKYNLEFQKKVFEYSGKRQLSPILDFPFSANMACGALRRNTYAVDPRGYYFKCTLEMGEAGKECGYVNDEAKLERYNEQCAKWDRYNPLEDKKCLVCGYLPFCMGNCPKVEFDNNSFYGRDGCIYWKSNLEDIVRLYVRAMTEVNTALEELDS